VAIGIFVRGRLNKNNRDRDWLFIDYVNHFWPLYSQGVWFINKIKIQLIIEHTSCLIQPNPVLY
jgi:hypothetical protein